MKQTTWKKSCSILLALAMLLSLMPTAFAAAATDISRVGFSVFRPIAYEYPTWERMEGPGFTGQVISWYEGSSWEKAKLFAERGDSHCFQPGKTYWPLIEFTPDSNHSMSTATEVKINQDTKNSKSLGIFNGGRLRATIGMKTIQYGLGSLYANLDEVIEGHPLPSKVGVPSDAHYSARVIWYKGNTWAHAEQLYDGYVSRAGETYWPWISIIPDKNYGIKRVHSMQINKKSVTDGHYVQDDGSVTGTIKYASFDVAIDQVSATVVAPSTGADQSTSIVVPKDAHYTAEVYGWYDGLDYYQATQMKPGAKYQSGRTYWVAVQFIPKPGYQMTFKTKAFINDKKGEELNRVTPEGNYMAAIKLLSHGDTQIDQVSATVTAPVMGTVPNWTAQAPSGAHYTTEVYQWYRGDTWSDAVWMEKGEKFTAGETYWVSVKYCPKSGYKMTDATQAKINGKAGEALNYVVERNGAYISAIRFAPVPKELSEMRCTVTKPVADAMPSNTVTVPSGADYTAKMYKWYVGDTWESCRQIANSVKFEPGKHYWVCVALTPNKGYKATPSTKVLINDKKSVALDNILEHDTEGIKAGSYMAVMDFQVDKKLYLSFNSNGGSIFEPVELKGSVVVDLTKYVPVKKGFVFDGWYRDAALTQKISSVKAEGKGVTVYAKWTAEEAIPPVVPETPGGTGFQDVSADAYYADAVKWAVENKITGGTGAGKFSPGMVCTRAQAVTFLWRAAGSPAPKASAMPFADVPADSYFADAVKWAVENNVTGGTGAGKFSPNMNCSRSQIVTFLWRAQGSPKVSATNTFQDVPTDAFYADAVAWAVANKVTGGTGSGKFSPNMDCSRAQIVTFLHRAYLIP